MSKKTSQAVQGILCCLSGLSVLIGWRFGHTELSPGNLDAFRGPVYLEPAFVLALAVGLGLIGYGLWLARRPLGQFFDQLDRPLVVRTKIPPTKPTSTQTKTSQPIPWVVDP